MWGSPIPARALPLTRRGFGVKKSEVMGVGDRLARDFLASNSLAVMRVPGMQRPAARKEFMTVEETDSQWCIARVTTPESHLEPHDE